MNKNVISITLIVLSFLIGILLYPQMPDIMASHWNARGQIDGYMSKFWALFIGPLSLLAIYLLFLVIPKIDPLKKNIKKFKKYFDVFIMVIIGFLFYVYLLSIFANLGYRFDMGTMMIPVLSILLFYSGVLIQHAKRNWFIGIRTPWTLSSDRVWKKTHKIGGKLFKAYGIFILLTLVFKGHFVCLILIPGIAILIGLFVYSYLEYQKERKK